MQNHLPAFWGVTAILAGMMTSPTSAPAVVTIPTAHVGNPGNAADTTGYGAVTYDYNIAKYDITNTQYAEFLNLKATSGDPYGLYNENMTTATQGGITRSGTTTFTYAPTTGYANKPVIYETWYDAIRFINWLTNGQGSGDTESGTYTITNGGFNSGTVVIPGASQRAAWAASGETHWLLPSENEWYKAAYYKGGNTNAGYWAYPFQSNAVPVSQAPPGGSNSANFYGPSGFALTHSTTFDSSLTYVTDVGAYSSGRSPYGAYDMGGNVWQWNETIIGSARGIRGSGWYDSSDYLASSNSLSQVPAAESAYIGFRVASVGMIVGDLNGDSAVNNFDISPFELALTDSATYLAQHPTLTNYPQRGDVNYDGAFNNFDISTFEQLLTGAPAAVVPEPSTFALLAIGGAGLLLWVRRRKASA